MSSFCTRRQRSTRQQTTGQRASRQRNPRKVKDKAMTIEPLDDRVLVEVDDSSTSQVSAGGIYLPDTAKEKPRIGLVLAVGTDEDLQEKVKVGNRVLYGKYSGDEVELDRKKVLVLQRNEILALVRD